jgi:hypothetical protein
MGNLYQDRWITCTEDEIIVAWYYLWGPKHIPYTKVRSVSQVDLTVLRGRGRVWGTANPRYWASLDPGRPGKSAGLILDLGGPVRAFLTPDDADAVAGIIVARAGLSGVRHLSRGPLM